MAAVSVKVIKKEASIWDVSFLSIQGKDSITNQKLKEATTFYNNKKYVEGLRLAFALYEQTKNNNHTKTHYLVTNLIAKIYRQNKEHKKAVVFYKKSLRLISLNPLYNKEFDSFNNRDYAENLLRLGAEYQLLKMNDSAIFYYNKLAEINSLAGEVLGLQASSYTNLAGIYQKDTTMLNHYEKAIELSERAIEVHEKRNNFISQAGAINNLASVYLFQGDFLKSKKTYLKGLKLIRRDTSVIAIRLKADLYYNLAWAMRNLKEYEAYDYQEISYDMQTGLRDDEMTQNIKRITSEYNVDVVRKEGKIQKQKAENLTLLIGISFFAIILLLAFFLNQYKLRQRNLSLQLSKQELAQQQKIEKVRIESQIRILNATLDGKETERKQIAETLHDSVSALLSSANLHLQAFKKLYKGPIPVEVEKSQNIIHEASHKIRNLSHTLVSSVLLKFGLAYAIKDMAEKYSNSQLDIEYKTKNIKRYDQDFEIKLHNIIQELVNNTIKHSEASITSIYLEDNDDKIKIYIKDNGKGFDKQSAMKKNGLGINQIDARIHMMKGQFKIESENNSGTSITIELPVVKKESLSFS
ncbi:ATP-binding protein [Flavobacteriaceae bacterium]|jgi:signal transduction histidine kinase|nr:ATP-binding protein [Flavobacteriaceae bacterium]MDB2661226.1 ATP-binding protein [Flavobacteriaceae bacterium]